MPICIVMVIAAACARAPSAEPSQAGTEVTAQRDMERLRAATRPFRSLDSAVAAGYPREVADCIVHAHHGAMGYHHLNRALVDASADVEHPEILLYERLPDETYRLNGVEFIVPYRFHGRDSTPPEVMGQTMKREDNLKYWYLHVWAWIPNAEGMFADFNPDVRCHGDAKVYTPSSEAPPPRLH
ncbi:MAG TPA: hypothetical protein VH277_15330 [Gemmatimonadaceae bacterium]|nr:hypothetical protein [Gemmatimonadaceae bacterium]